jgi:2-amino-4-hydroxy-6-hydroxymethyldihydropteridine diphosphokinase
MSFVYIGIGSNLGDRRQNIERAIEKLKSRRDITFACLSSIIETDPVGDSSQPKFLNACCRIDTTLYPDEVLGVLKSIEREMGRGRESIPKKLNIEEQLRALDEAKVSDSVSGAEKTEEKADNKWAPRIIDLDILLYDDIIMKGNNLTIPHKLMHERLFVLQPLSEIAPEAIHPVFNKSISQLLSEFSISEGSVAEVSESDSPEQKEANRTQ